MSKSIAVFELGTSKMVCASVKGSKGGKYSVAGFKSIEYGGITSNGCINFNDVRAGIKKLVGEMDDFSQGNIKFAVIGVPACFCEVLNFYESIEVDGGVIREDHIEKCVNSRLKHISKEKALLNAAPAYFILDDGFRYMDPEGMASKTLKASVSYTITRKDFLTQILQIFASEGIPVKKFIPDFYAESMYLIPDYKRDEMAAVINCGATQTVVSVICADAIICNKVIDIGGETLTSDLSKVLRTDSIIADKLKRRCTFGVGYADDKDIVLKDNRGMPIHFNANLVNEILEARVEQLSEKVYNILNNSLIKFYKSCMIVLTGGGLTPIKGAREYLSNKIDRDITVAKMDVFPYESFKYTTIAALADEVFKYDLPDEKVDLSSRLMLKYRLQPKNKGEN